MGRLCSAALVKQNYLSQKTDGFETHLTTDSETS